MARRHALIVGNRPGHDIFVALSASEATAFEEISILNEVADVEKTELDGLDLVVHCAYPDISRRRCDLVDMTAADWTAACDEPLEAAIRLAQRTHRHLAAHNGTIVFLVPLMASAGGEGFTPFATAAEGVRLLAKSLAKTWGSDGITAHAITLDPHAFLDDAAADGIAEANALHDPPLGHIPDVRTELTPIIEALASHSAAALTGASLVVDGGLWMPG